MKNQKDQIKISLLLGGTEPTKLYVQYHAVLALQRRVMKQATQEECLQYLKNLFQQPVFLAIKGNNTKVGAFAALYYEPDNVCFFVRINANSIFLGSVLKKYKNQKILVNPNDERYVIHSSSEASHVKSKENEWFEDKNSWKTDCRAARNLA